MTGTVDAIFSQNTVEARDSTVGIWFNHNNVTSEWTDGPVAGNVRYAERFNQVELKDYSYQDSLTNNRAKNKSIGGNLTWESPFGLQLQLDAHHSTAVAKPKSPYGSNNSVGTIHLGIQNQFIDFSDDLPVANVVMYPGVDLTNASQIVPSGNAFRSVLFTDRINQGQLIGKWNFDTSFLKSVDFGVSHVDNKVRSASAQISNNTWGGAAPASAIPDDIFRQISLPDKFKGISGSKNPNLIQNFWAFDFEKLVKTLDDLNQICGGTLDCIADYNIDRRITEKTISPYIQVNNQFDLFGNSAHLSAGVRYEKTKTNSSSLVPVYSGTQWVAANEIVAIQSGDSIFASGSGKYDYWLPAIDADISPLRNVKLRASYSHTITRPDYASLQGGETINLIFNPRENGTGNSGNPNLSPFLSKNIDASAEWYYGPTSYVSVGYFRKNVTNFIANERVTRPVQDLRNPGDGPRARAALAALPPGASNTAVRQYIFDNYPGSVVKTGTDSVGNTTGYIIGLPEDNAEQYFVSTPVNSDRSAVLYGFEFAVQHSFWETGFGAILNYTIVKGDATYDNTQPATVTQFALTGLSNSANAVLFYDKNGLQARVAYNWRDQFLTQTGPNPFYVEAYGQIDASASYEFNNGLTVFAEGINLTNEARRGHQRSNNNVTFVNTGRARYAAGARFRF